MKILISESQYNMLCEEKEEFFIPRRSREERKKFWRAAIYKQIQRYIKNGSTGNLNLARTPVLLLPDNLIYVGGNLDLSHTQITKLPDNLTVNNWLDLEDTLITKLPDNLTVDSWVDLQDTNISEIPKNLRIGRNLWLRGTPLGEKYTEDQIIDIIIKYGGSVKGEINL